MKLTFERWAAILVLGCLALATAFMPVERPESSRDRSDAEPRPPQYLWELRMRARSTHLAHVLGEYRTARTMKAAKDAFGSRAGVAGDPEIWFESGIPAAYRESFKRALDAERNQRGDWKGHGKVGVMVSLDTISAVDGYRVTWLQSHQRARVTKLRVIPPSAATGDRCVVSIAVPSVARPLSDDGNLAGNVAPLLDACAFYDAFGAPGAALARELSDARMEFARGYVPGSADTLAVRPAGWYWQIAPGTSVSPALCLSGNDAACIAQLSESPWRYAPLVDDGLSASVPGISSTQARMYHPDRFSTLNRIARELGPARFLRVWQSPKSLAESYYGETGETLAQALRRKETAEYGGYHNGPWLSSLTTELTVLTIAALFWLALRYAPRPTAA